MKVLLFLLGLGIIGVILLALWRNGLPSAMGLMVKAATGIVIAVMLLVLLKVILSLREPADQVIDPSLRQPSLLKEERPSA